MAVAPFEIIAGPAVVHVAAANTAFPAITGISTTDLTAAVSGFTYLGRTEGGIQVAHSQQLNLLKVDQTIFAVKAIRTDIGCTVSFQLAEITLERYSKVLYDATVTTTGTSPQTKSFGMGAGVDVTRFALVVRGPSPYANAFMHYEIPVCVRGGEPQVRYTRDDKAVLAVEYMVLEDPTAQLGAGDAFKLGRLIAQSAL